MNKKLFTSLALFCVLAITSCNFAPNNNENNKESEEEQSSEPAQASSEHTKHTWSDWVIDQPKACEEGTKTRTCTVCGQTETQKVPAGDHTFGALQVVTPATCGEGVAKRVCSACGKEESIAILPIQDHNWAAATVEHTAEAGEVAETYESCAACNQTRTSWQRGQLFSFI